MDRCSDTVKSVFWKNSPESHVKHGGNCNQRLGGKETTGTSEVRALAMGIKK